jgi:hypothetical protein
VDAAAAEHLQPIAASFVLAILGSRYRQDEEAVETEESQPSLTHDGEEPPALGSAKGGIMTVLFAAMGSAIMRALMNRLLPRRRRTGYSYRSRSLKRRRRRRREPRLEDLFRDLLR